MKYMLQIEFENIEELKKYLEPDNHSENWVDKALELVHEIDPNHKLNTRIHNAFIAFMGRSYRRDNKLPEKSVLLEIALRGEMSGIGEKMQKEISALIKGDSQ